MRRIVLVSLFALLVAGASAQGRGEEARAVWLTAASHFRPAFTGGHGYSSPRQPQVTAIFPYGYGYLASGYGYGYSDGDTAPYDAGGYTFSPQQGYFEPSPPPPSVIQVAPKPAHPVLTNYTWPAASAPSAAVAPEAEAQTFGIVLKDGSTLAATTIVAADDVLHYVDPDERHMRVSMSAVDRAATLKLNRERKLTLYLPATPQ